MLSSSLHNAPGQMRGYLFQIERALHSLSQEGENGIIGVETGDDVVTVTRVDGVLHAKYEQDKSSISTTAPFGNYSKDLWNTLKIWLKAISDGKIERKSSQFLMVSNVKMPSGRFVFKIDRAFSEESLEKCVIELRVLGSRHKGKLKSLIEEVLSFSDDDLKELVKRVTVLDSEYVHDRNGFKKSIKENLHISDKLPFNEIYTGLMGWLFDSICDSWDNRRQAWVTVQSMNDKLSDLIGHYKRRPFIEKAVMNLPVSDKQRRNQQEQTFVKQLELIKAREQTVLNAMDDYLRASWERTRYAKQNQVTRQDFEDFEELLLERWKQVSDKELSLSEDSRKEIIGSKIYFNTINDHREKLVGVETEQYYTTKGAYHRLSDILKLGWHPEWKKLKNE